MKFFRGLSIILLILLSLFSSINSYAGMSKSVAQGFVNQKDAYQLVNADEASASTRYYGFLRADGYWYIMKQAISSSVSTYTFVKGTSAYSTAWTDRASETYASFDTVFVDGI